MTILKSIENIMVNRNSSNKLMNNFTNYSNYNNSNDNINGYIDNSKTIQTIHGNSFVTAIMSPNKCHYPLFNKCPEKIN
ncbi:hypothetical protein RB653_007766 [Dictyostelium firmibasis]|uniref:Uncharacterized protein n=1 Tax=Dictyostelium firmibasis TaxID=79012 RepID=A0AAN7YUY6_9MYCE